MLEAAEEEANYSIPPSFVECFPSLSHRAVLLPCSSWQRPATALQGGSHATRQARSHSPTCRHCRHPPQPLCSQALDPLNEFIPRDVNEIIQNIRKICVNEASVEGLCEILGMSLFFVWHSKGQVRHGDAALPVTLLMPSLKCRHLLGWKQ